MSETRYPLIEIVDEPVGAHGLSRRKTVFVGGAEWAVQHIDVVDDGPSPPVVTLVGRARVERRTKTPKAAEDYPPSIDVVEPRAWSLPEPSPNQNRYDGTLHAV